MQCIIVEGFYLKCNNNIKLLKLEFLNQDATFKNSNCVEWFEDFNEYEKCDFNEYDNEQ